MDINKRACYLIPLFFAFLGVLPHLIFSINLGKFTYLEYAWDENTYTYMSLFGDHKIYRAASGTILQSLYALGNDSIDVALILMDAIMPFIIGLIIVRIAIACGFKTWQGLLAACSLLAFPTAFLAFGDINFWGKWIQQVSPFAMQGIAAATKGIIPSLNISFFPLFRTPEPQTSLVIQLAIFLVLLRAGGRFGMGSLMLLAALCLLLPFTYVSIGISVLIFMLGYAALGLVVTKQMQYLKILLLGLLASAYYAATFMSQMQGDTAVSFIFRSHLPIITPSVIIGICGIFYIIKANLSKIKGIFKPCDILDKHILAFSCFAIPLITLNQQLITGTMVQSRNWEFYTNYTFIAAGLLLLYPELVQLCKRSFKPRTMNALCILLLLALVGAQIKSFNRFVDRGLAQEAAAQLVAQLQTQDLPINTKILLESPPLEGAIFNKLGKNTPNYILPGYVSLIKNQSQIAALSKDGYTTQGMPNKDVGFTLFAQKGFTAEKLQDNIVTQIDKGLCDPDLQYFYWTKDCSGVLTDFRALEIEKIKASIPALVEDYKSFLSDSARQKSLGNVILITERKKDDAGNETEISSLTIGTFKKKTVYAYR